HFFAKLGEHDAAATPALATFLDLITGASSDRSPIDLTIANGQIPTCAMKVRRDEDLGPLMSYAPERPCGCYFDWRATGNTTCDACDSNDACPTSSPICRYGFCEAY